MHRSHHPHKESWLKGDEMTMAQPNAVTRLSQARPGPLHLLSVRARGFGITGKKLLKTRRAGTPSAGVTLHTLHPFKALMYKYLALVFENCIGPHDPLHHWATALQLSKPKHLLANCFGGADIVAAFEYTWGLLMIWNTGASPLSNRHRNGLWMQARERVLQH